MRYLLPRVIGHRGAMRRAPENTLAGLDQAAREGAGWVEFDVKLTADDVPILMHDQNLRRTTGLNAPVRDTDYRTIRELDAGIRFDAAYAGERVPTLREALERCAGLGLTPNIEIKPCPGRARATALAVTEAIKASWPKAELPPLLSSFSARALLAARRDAPGYPRGLLSNRLPAGWRALAHRLGLTALHLNGMHVTTAQIADCRAAGLPVVAWTINHPRLAAGLVAAGVQTIITDCPGDIRAALAQLPPALQRLRRTAISEQAGDDDDLDRLLDGLMPLAGSLVPAAAMRVSGLYGRLSRFAINRWA